MVTFKPLESGHFFGSPFSDPPLGDGEEFTAWEMGRDMLLDA